MIKINKMLLAELTIFGMLIITSITTATIDGNIWTLQSSHVVDLTVHNINKGTDYTTIQIAIDDANIGDEIHADSGTYNENVNVTKQLILRGINIGIGMPIVRAFNPNMPVFNVSVDNVSISGFNITGADMYNFPYTASGILLYGKHYGKGIISADISNNTIINNYFGIYTFNSHYNNISNNIIVSNVYSGIQVHDSENNNIANNMIRNNGAFGLEATGGSRYNDIIYNTVAYNFHSGIKTENTRSNNFIGNMIYSNWFDGIWISNSHANVITNNNVANNANGIDILYSVDNMINKNSLKYNSNGLRISGCAISSDYCGNNAVTGNNISDNNFGISISNSKNNIIYDNYLNNIFDVDDQCTYAAPCVNSLNITKTDSINIIGRNYIGGNFWANPYGTGFSQTCINRGDGFCNSSYVLDSNNIDYLPLVIDQSICGNTPNGQNIQVAPTANINIIFSSVIQCGNTVTSISDNQWGALPNNYNPITFYEINTTANYTNSISIQITYLDSDILPNINESSIKLFHYENGDWIDITTSLDIDSNTIMGTVTSLSPFAIAGTENVIVTPTVSPTISPTMTPISGSNVVKGSSFDIINVMVLTICLAFISILRIRKR